MIISKQNIFLVDGIGAGMTALLLSQVLARFPAVFGLTPGVLYPLTAVAILFAIYSLTNHFVGIWKPRNLRIIAYANLGYCLVTIYIIICVFDQITWLGLAYFAAELVIIIGLVWVELRMSKSDPK